MALARMRGPWPRGVFVAVAVVSFLFSALPPPVAHGSSTYNCSGTGCAFWYDDAVWNNRYAGNTVRVDLNVYNTWAGSPTDTITSAQVTTPWGTFTDNTVPKSVCYGCSYFFEANATIPSTTSPGDYTITVTFTGTYSSGSAMNCVGSSNGCSDSFTIYVSANPVTLQSQVTTLQQSIAALNANITSLNSQIATLQTQQAALQAQLSTAKGNITSLKASLATTNAQLGTAKANLNTAQNQLAATQATLASTQSSLSNYSNLYLPLGVAVPSVIAALMLVLYLRKKPGSPQAISAPPPPPG